ncbi:MAG: low molecular weight protein arginine phosphatase [Candidatus Eisenbacteria bacterium]|nr:low molecular weight protein arginine phosphatase [Candidatus Eisenbacteria bacterium]
MPYNVLLVCSGNTCRTAMAQGTLRELLREAGADGIRVTSAGTLGIEGAPATPEAVTVAAESRVDISDHRSSALTPERIESADLILAMARHHVDEITDLVPAAAGKTHLLSTYAGRGDEDVPDPIGGDLDEYRSSYGLIRDLLRSALPRILENER